MLESKPYARLDKGGQGSLLSRFCPELPLACMIYKYRHLAGNTG